MSSSRPIASYPFARAWQPNAVAAAWAIGLVSLVAAAVVAVLLIVRLNEMSSSLAHVSARLETLTSMNQKLVTLDDVDKALHHMNDKLSLTNRSLDAANQKLESMQRDSKVAGRSLSNMQRTLTGMQGDIHTMSHKLSNSFLFRSIK